MAAVAPPNIRPDFNPLVNIFRDELPNLADSSTVKRIVDVLDSGALGAITNASLKNIPYLSGNYPTASGITARLRYLEAGLMSQASLVHSVVFTVVFTALAVLTLGQVGAINDLCKREWIHTALAAGSVFAGFAGALVPKLGLIVHMGIVGLAGAGIVVSSQKDVIDTAKGVYLRNRERFQEAGRALVGNDEMIFDRSVRPILGYVDQHIEGVQTFSDVRQFMEGLAPYLPSVPTVPADLSGTQNLIQGVHA